MGRQLCWKDHLVFICNAVCIDVSPSRCTLAKATDQHHERVSPLRGSLLAASAARFGPSALKVRSFWMDYIDVCVYRCMDVGFSSTSKGKPSLSNENTMTNFVKLCMWIVGGTSTTHVVCHPWMGIFNTSFAYLFWLANNKKVKYPEFSMGYIDVTWVCC